MITMLFEKHGDGICRGYHENRKERRGTSFRVRKLVRAGEARPNSKEQVREKQTWIWGKSIPGRKSLPVGRPGSRRV